MALIPPLKINTYVGSWHAWWVRLQPEWRQQDKSWPMSQIVDDDHDWSILLQSGPNGFFIIMLTLMWWGLAVKNGSSADQMQEFELAVKDVGWVLSQILKIPIGSKRRLDGEVDGENGRSSKR